METVELNLANLDRHIQSSFDAITLLYQNKHYPQARYCAFILIDQLAWLVSGSEQHVNVYFKSWLNKYFTKHYPGISADEIWEHRNGLLHNNSSISRKIEDGRVKRQLWFVDKLEQFGSIEYGTDANELGVFTNTYHFMQVALYNAVIDFRSDIQSCSKQEVEEINKKLGKILQPVPLL